MRSPTDADSQFTDAHAKAMARNGMQSIAIDVCPEINITSRWAKRINRACDRFLRSRMTPEQQRLAEHRREYALRGAGVANKTKKQHEKL